MHIWAVWSGLHCVKMVSHWFLKQQNPQNQQTIRKHSFSRIQLPICHACLPREPVLAVPQSSKCNPDWRSAGQLCQLWYAQRRPREDTVTVSYGIPDVGLETCNIWRWPQRNTNDWRSYSMDEQSFTVPARLIQSVNPTISKTHVWIPFYLLQSSVLVALTASLF